MKPQRIEALCDGIFAIVMTLLVLDLKVPSGLAAGELPAAVAGLWPKFLAFLASFVLLGIYWGAHHTLFAIIRRGTFYFMWVNVALMLPICLVPFSTALLGEYLLDPVAQTVYAANLILVGLLLYATYHYATIRHNLTEREEFSEEFRRNVKGKMLIPAATYAVAIPVAPFSPVAALVLLAAGPVIYFLPVDSKAWQALIRR